MKVLSRGAHIEHTKVELLLIVGIEVGILVGSENCAISVKTLKRVLHYAVGDNLLCACRLGFDIPNVSEVLCGNACGGEYDYRGFGSSVAVEVDVLGSGHSLCFLKSELCLCVRGVPVVYAESYVLAFDGCGVNCEHKAEIACVHNVLTDNFGCCILGTYGNSYRTAHEKRERKHEKQEFCYAIFHFLCSFRFSLVF